ncbi:MAG: hypothetical protein M0R05_03480 [Bacilli bacterium]|nr:hypothetical protein [Bacilli bacterium]MDD4077151.1 hypothetical protein [Bacilli bacterium]
MNRNLFASLGELYNLRFSSFKPITSKAFRLKCKDDEYYIFAKKSNIYSQEKYRFLYEQGISNIAYPLKNNKGNFITNINKNYLYLSDYYRDFDIVGEIKAVNMVDELSNLHYNTYFKRQLSVDFSRKNMEELFEYLDYKFTVLEMFIRSVEARPFDEYSIVILKNYQYLLDAKAIMSQLHKQLIAVIKEKKSVNYAFIHNNPKTSHLLTASGKHYLTSIEKSKMGIPSLDMAKFYIENEHLNFDIKNVILPYLDKYEDEFYRNYFYFLVLLYYIKGLTIIDKDYATAQNFIFAAHSIKKFMNLFGLIDEDKTE